MQFGVLCILTIAVIGNVCPVKAELDDDIINLLEDFRARMCHPFPQWGIPALDPFQITHKEIFIDDTIFKNFSASVTNLKSTGLSDFIINQVKVSVLSRKFTFDLTFPLTNVESLYTAKGSLAYILNLIGDDNMIGHIKEVRIIVTGAMKIGLSFGIKNLKIIIKIDELFVDFGHLIEHDRINNFFHNLINNLTIELLDDFWEDYGESYTAKIENLINKTLSEYTFKEIIAIISGSGSGSPIFGDDPPGDCKDGVNVFNPNVILVDKN